MYEDKQTEIAKTLKESIYNKAGVSTNKTYETAK